MAGSILGTEVVRREDGTLLTGEGQFTGDLWPDGLLTAHFVRSSVAHGQITSIDCEGAARGPDVVGVYTGANPALGGVLPVITRVMATGVYGIEQVQFDYGWAATNRAPLGAFRGAGRPQATLTIERMADLAAAELGIDPAEFRRRNFLAPEDFPLVTPTGGAYDTGEYKRALDRACELVGYKELRAELDHTTDGPTFPFGTQIGVVEVDTETGMVALLRFVAVDDAGNPLTTGLADYAMPSAAEFCDFTVDNTITPTHLNPLGVKGIGEAATIGATPAVQNAVIDALSDLGIRHIDLPLTPERVWQAIQTAGGPAPAIVWPSL